MDRIARRETREATQRLCHVFIAGIALLSISSHADAGWVQVTSAAPWAPRTESRSVVFDNKLWVLGGETSEGAGKMSDVWSSPDGVNWTQVTSSAPWGPRAFHTVVVHNNRMWILGGETNSGMMNDVWSSSDGATWTLVAPSAPWTVRGRHAAVVYDDLLWIMGGYTSTGGANDVWSSPDGITWTRATAAAAWSVRNRLAALTFDGKMWVVGGYWGAFYNDVWYSTDGATWNNATSSAAWSSREACGVAAYLGKMRVLGGGAGTRYSDMWSSTDGVTWTSGPDPVLWSGRREHATAVFQGRLYVLGGETVTGSANDVWYIELTPPPVVASDVAVSTPRNTPVSVTLAATGGVGALVYNTTSLPAHGELSGTAPNLTYTPSSTYLGEDNFEYTATDSLGTDSNTATVSISVGLIYYVDASRPDNSGDGRSWATAKKTVSAAITAASASEQVWIKAGTYAEAISMKSGVAVYGGFSGTESDPSQRDYSTNVTGINAGTLATPNHVVTFNGVTNSRLDGVTIAGGDAVDASEQASNPNSNGGGIFSVNSDSTNVIANCLVTGNTAAWGGGMACFSGACPTVTQCRFSGNTARYGGGAVYKRSAASSLNISASRFLGNQALWSDGSKLPSVFGGIGGAICYDDASNCLITNSEFRGNIVNASWKISWYPGQGAALYIAGGSPLSVVNCTFSGNTWERNTGNGTIYGPAGAFVLTNCILWNDPIGEIATASTVSYSDVQGGYAGTGNINTDPLFISSTDLRLQSGSPCRDTGTNSGAPSQDLRGSLRPQGAGHDMGAYEFGLTAAFTATPQNGFVPQVVQFTDQPATDGPAITDWLWDFGDTGSSTIQNPSHTYTAPGVYTVSLTVSGGSFEDTETKEDYIVIALPPIPAPPTNPGITEIAATQCRVTWQDNSDNETGFKVWGDPGIGVPTTLLKTTAADVQFADVSNLVPNTQYAYQVAATNAGGDSEKTSTYTAWTLAAVPNAPVVSNPGVHTLDVGIGNGDGNPPETEYALQVLPGVAGNEWIQPDGTLGTLAAFQTAAAWATLTVTGLAEATAYNFHAQARNNEGTISASGPAVQGTTLDGTEPSFIGITATPSEAAEGDTVQITFDTSEPLDDEPEVLVNGHSAAPVARKNSVTFEYTIQEPTIDPLGPATIQISGADLAGNFGISSSTTALTIVLAAPSVPVAAWPAALALAALGAFALRRRRDTFQSR